MADRYFDLSLRLENAGMQTDGDIAAALRQIADVLTEGDDGVRSNPTVGQERITDINGQKTGYWMISNSRRIAESYR